ncbi:Acyl-coenzyme A thioesterase 5 [Chionoecetes opilio]|uniref:Acyl-coenzyme A thioesterase 5 n=1 Tax=Chionoecetes opilio TaxID=41210 RepID=A0A8J4YMC6_CHIOP|nr:Acyl-coenzyme A thioesterase 5 [Chionoecetes opilio]
MVLLHARKSLQSGWLFRLTAPPRVRQRQGVGVRGMAGVAGQGPGSDPWITATPRVCLHDVPTALRAGGLAPHAPVTLSASLTDENGKQVSAEAGPLVWFAASLLSLFDNVGQIVEIGRAPRVVVVTRHAPRLLVSLLQFVSHAHYRTDDRGSVDVRTAAAVGGSYTGVFSSGLLTTLAPAPHEFPFLRLYRRDPHLPWKVTVRLRDGHHPLATHAQALAEVELERHLMAQGVRRVAVREGRVRGALYLPPGDGPFPAVIDMFGSAGGLMEFRSAMMASRGIASLALAYFAYDDLPKTTDVFELDYFEEAVEALLGRAEVVPDRCGVVAVSKAVDVACCMATWLPKVKAVVCISGSPIAVDSVITHRGHTLVEGVKLNLSIMTADKNGCLYPQRKFLTQEGHVDHPKFIPIEQADDDTFFLMAAGANDAWSSDFFVHLTQERMESKGRGAWVEAVEYPGAGHIIEPPYGPHIRHSYHRHLPVTSEDGSDKVEGVPLLWGGNAEDTCRAQEDLWPRMTAFFTRHVRDNSRWYRQHGFCSCAHYVTDGAGGVDVRVAESVGGSYEGVFPAGLLTTLVPAPHELSSLRLYRRDTTLPWKIQVSVLDGHHLLGAKAEATAEVELERHLMASGVRRVPVREGRVRGVLYLPPGDGPFPGVIDMFGSIGGIMEFRSAMLASRGFASLALAFFGYDDLPTDTHNIDLDYFEEAVEVLLAVPEVIPDRCGAVAISKSGDILLSMATLIPAVKAVVGISCCTFVYHSRMTYKGKLFRQGTEMKKQAIAQTERGTLFGSMKDLFTNDNPAMIPVEEADHDTHFLLAVGDDDAWQFKHSLPTFRERMLSHDKHNFETILYPGTGHIIEPPYGPLISQSFQRHIPSDGVDRGMVMEWGGQPQPTCAAQEDLWHRMRTFLTNHVMEESPWYQQHLARHAPRHTSKL